MRRNYNISSYRKTPWATCLQHTSQAGNDGQGESSGQLQPGAIVMGFFMDGEQAQMPIVIGVLRVQKSNDTKIKQQFAELTGEAMEPGLSVNASALHPSQPNSTMAGTKEEGFLRQSDNNAVALPGLSQRAMQVDQVLLRVLQLHLVFLVVLPILLNLEILRNLFLPPMVLVVLGKF